MDRVKIFDTTLRDGEQSPGAAMSGPARLRVARMLEAAQVDVIEAGFPAASPLVAGSVAQIARQVKSSTVAALARCHPGDIDAARQALQGAQRPRIHAFLATSEIHLEKKLRMTREAALGAIDGAVRRAKRDCDDVEFSAEDATRTDREFLAEVFSVAIAAGATTINVPDTVGFTMPREFEETIRYLFANVREVERATMSVHTHDDLGVATANALAAVGVGARQVECTINGIGERAGNCSLEEVVIALRIRRDVFACDTAFDAAAIQRLSRAVARATRMPVQKNKAIVGANAFAHESGIHQDGVLKDRRTYEIVDPLAVGMRTALPLGRNSGRHALFSRASQIGLAFDDLERARFERAFRAFADHRRNVTDADLMRLAASCKEIRTFDAVPTVDAMPVSMVR